MLSQGQDATIIEETGEDDDFFDENQPSHPAGKTPGFGNILSGRVSKRDNLFEVDRGTSFKFRSGDQISVQPLRPTVQAKSPPSDQNS